jgi:hypothetical protein
MTISAKNIQFDGAAMLIELSNARTLRIPLARFPRLLNATPGQLNDWELTPRGIHWDALDEDISIDGLLEEKDAPRPHPHSML